MSVEILLRRDVDSLGTAGEVVNVRPGYARNYLLPKGLALELTAENRNRVESVRKRIAREGAERLEGARALAERLAGLSCTIPTKVGEQGQMYAAVGVDAIVDALTKEEIEVPADAVGLDRGIKELGVYEVPVRLHPEVTVSLKVWVVEA